jgi:long-chain acyl-CoA synthetase
VTQRRRFRAAPSIERAPSRALAPSSDGPEIRTIRALIDARARLSPRAPAVYHRVGRRWRALTITDLLERVDRVAHAYTQLGLQPGDRLGIMCRTRLEWLIAELGAMAAGLVVVGIDAHASDAQIAHVLSDSAVAGLIVDRDEALGRIDAAALVRLKLIVAIDDAPRAGAAREVHAWPALAGTLDAKRRIRGRRKARPRAGPVHDAPRDAPDAPATLLYTSGTTGKPRGILYRHKHLAEACRSILEEFPGLARRGATTICWLPMAALFQRMMNYVALASRVAIYFVDDPTTIGAAAKSIQPTYFVGVPRFFEKLYQGIHQQLAARPARTRRLVEYAVAHSPRRPRSERRRLGGVPARILDAVVLRRVRGALGHRLRFMITGSAPAPTWLLEYFHRIGILLLEAYGLSENTVPIAANRPDAYRFGSVGRPFRANDVRIDAQGEILVRGPGLFDGYLHEQGRPGEAFTGDGFYRTGDLGRLDEDGFLFITGRRSDLFKTSTGRWISPARIEAAYKRIPYIEQIVVLGRGRPYPVALLSLNSALLKTTGRPARPERDAGDSDAALRARIDADLAAADVDLTEHERIRRYAFLPAPLSLQQGELTATLKLRRDVIEQRHAALIEALYAPLS